jgi:DNA modification methylase
LIICWERGAKVKLLFGSIVNQLILGDCLEALKKLESESVDLIYLDPPFFSNRNYEVIWGDKGEVRSFEDRWSGGVDHYIAWLKERVEQMHRVLKPTGSIFLHCDWHANAEIKVFILNKLFGVDNFRNEIIWKRMTSSGYKGKCNIGRNQDFIFYYTKSNSYTFNPIYIRYSQDYIKTRFSKIDEQGRCFKDEKVGTATSDEAIEKLKKEGRIYVTATGKLRIKHFLENAIGVPIDDLWLDIPPVNSQASERVGYPTQKPEALLERIINMTSNEGDLVLDPFNGGGTTVAVADRLNRHWIGIDSSVSAIKVTQFRLEKKQTDIFAKPFTVQLHKYDYDTLRYKDAFEFEKFIVQQFGGISNTKQRGDLGLDGKTQDGTPIQVKRSDDIGRNPIDNFKSACERFDKTLFDKNKAQSQPVGVIIAFSFGKGAIQEVARLKNQENLIFQLVKVEDIVPIEKKPILRLAFDDLGLDEKNLRMVNFIANAESNSGIEFFSWDFNYSAEKGFQAEIMIDKEGKQSQKFKAGTHCIAVKVVDNDGLESIEVITLKINGKAQKLN